MSNVSVVGLGKLGATLAAVLANAGHRVYGVDTNARSVDAINAGFSPVDETGLDDLIKSLPKGQLTAHLDYSEAIPNTDITMIVVPTPSDRDDKFSNDYVLSAIDSVGHHLSDQWHTVVVCSTMMPGSSDKSIVPALEAASGRKVGAGLGYCYNPEFIALGSVIHDMTHPDLVLIGSQDERSEADLVALSKSYVQNDPTFGVLRYVDAELAKISVNTFVTMKISYANTIAEIAEALPGGSASSVLNAVGSDSRVGRKYLKPGASFGGPCFPRDNRAFAALAEEVGADAPLAGATDHVNKRTAYRVAAILRDFGTVAILGLAYKPDTAITEESMGTLVARTLAYAGVEVRAHDPQARPPMPPGATQYDTVDEAIMGADVVLVTCPWEEYKTIDFKGTQILDAWNHTSWQANRRVLGEHCWWWHA